MKIHEDKVQDEKREQELLFHDFKKLGLKNKKLKDKLKSKTSNPNKRNKRNEDGRK